MYSFALTIKAIFVPDLFHLHPYIRPNTRLVDLLVYSVRHVSQARSHLDCCILSITSFLFLFIVLTVVYILGSKVASVGCFLT